MEPQKSMRIPLVIGGIIVAVVIALYWYSKPTAKIPASSADTSLPGVGADISGAVQNPAEAIPEANPFKAETNPFAEYPNPFE